MPVQIEATVQGVQVKLGLDFRVPVSNLKPCNAQIIASWSWKKAKNEEWLVHLNHQGSITMKKIAEPKQS